MQTISIDDFEKNIKDTFTMKSEVDIKNLTDVVRKQLKLKMNTNEINLDKLFQEVRPDRLSRQMFSFKGNLAKFTGYSLHHTE